MFYTLTACIVLNTPSMPVSVTYRAWGISRLVLDLQNAGHRLLPKSSRQGLHRHTKLAMYDMGGVAIENIGRYYSSVGDGI